jgi:Peptidase propeptide and YPEB domain
MKMRSPKGLGLIALTIAALYALFNQTANADRAPTQEERGRIEQALRGLGFVSWKEIELDNGHWEIDDARHSDGKKYDLELNAENLKVTKQKEDD